MEACAPPVFWDEGICYRRNPYLIVDNYQEEQYEDTKDLYADDHFDGETQEIEDLSSSFNIEKLPNGNFKTSFHVANAYYGFLIGKGGSTKQRLEVETKTRIQIPKSGSKGPSEITVTGPTKAGIYSACNRIKMIVLSARARQPFTHFVSIPMNTTELKRSFSKFKDEVLDLCKGARGIDKTVFQDPSLLHLTVCTVPLMDETERNQVSEILNEFKGMFQGEESIVRVEGLEIMNDDKAEVDVLYAKIKPADSKNSQKLQSICDQISKRLVEANFSNERYDCVKLHLTLMNSLFRKDPSLLAESQTSNQEVFKRETFDARPIFEHFSNFNFGQVEVSEIHLSQRRSHKRGNDDYYAPSQVVSLTSIL